MGRNTEKHTVPTIDLEQLYPGDVLLTTEASFNSWIIRKATRSEYSHAILYVGEGLLIESGPEEGVAFKTLTLVKAEPAGKYAYRIFATIPKAVRIHVYRHKDLAFAQPPITPEQRLNMMFQVHKVLPDKWGKDYSLLEALGQATPLLNWAPKFKRFILRRVGRLGPDKGKVVPSEFCSELVASALADLKMPAFNECRPGEIPSPQSFAEPGKSNMVRVLAEETGPNPLIASDQEKLQRKQQTLDIHLGAHFNADRKRQHHVMAILEDVNSITQKIAIDTQNKLKQLDRR